MPTALTTSSPSSSNAWWRVIDNPLAKRVQALLDAGQDPGEKHPKTGETALDRLLHGTIAARPEAAKAIALLIAAGANPFRTFASHSPFALAMATRDPAMARAMITASAWASNPTRPRVSCATHAGEAMTLTIRHHPALVRTLLDRGVSPNVGTARHTPLVDALHEGNLATVTVLLDAGARLPAPQPRKTFDAYALVVDAVVRNDETPATFHVRQAAVVDLLDARGWTMAPSVRATILGLAVRNRCPLPLLQRLVELGADPSGTTPRGLTALHIAVDGPGGYPYVDPLLAMGLDVSTRNRAGQSVLDRLQAQALDDPRAQALIAHVEGLVLHRHLNEQPAPPEPLGDHVRRRL